MSERKTTRDRLGRDPLGQAAQQSLSPDGLGPSGEHPSRGDFADKVVIYHTEDRKYWLEEGWGMTSDHAKAHVYDRRRAELLLKELEDDDDDHGRLEMREPYSAPAIEAQGAETRSGSVEDESAIGKAEAPVNSVLLSALKAMDAALTRTWGDPLGNDAGDFEDPVTMKAWLQIRSAIAQAQTPSRS